jgi:hypothetical protein|tara:strand:- start:1730 stop:1858 length:129 start_codon:yes stop_codon:yes gene_type:complete
MPDQIGSNIEKTVKSIAFNVQLKEFKKILKKIKSDLQKLKKQ